MLGESLEKFDRKIVIVSLVAAALTLGVLLRDDLLVKFLKKRGGGEVIGRVLSMKNDVRRRQSQSLTWYDAYSNEAISERDALFTGSDSELTVEILGNQQFSLDANSLVVMHTKGNELLLDLQLGGVASLAKTEQTIKVMTEGKVATIKADKKAAPVFIKKNARGTLTILSRTGDVEVSIGDKKTKIKQNEAVTVEPMAPVVRAPEPMVAKVEPDPVPELEPLSTPEKLVEEQSEPYGPQKPPPLAEGVRPSPLKPTQKIVLKFKDGVNARSPSSVSKGIVSPPVLEWRAVDNAKDYYLEISTHEKFDDPLLYDPIEKTSMVWREVTPGDFYWRVKARGFHDDETIASQTSKLIVELSPPELTTPALEDEMTEDPEKLETPKEGKIDWPEIPMAKGYRFIASVEGQAVQNSVLMSSDATLKVAPNKETAIKVAAVDGKGQAVSAYSEKTLSFKRELQVKAPQISLPIDQTVIVAFDKKRISPLLFAWGATKGATEYEIQFAFDSGFKNIVKEEKVKERQFLLKERLIGEETFWRVRARIKDHASAWSKPRTFRIQSSSG